MKKKVAVFLTTIDNPFNPMTQWDDWKRFDTDKGYYTSEYLSRIAITSHHLSEEEYLTAIEEAIDRILDTNVLGIYKKLVFYDENTVKK